MFEIIDCDFIDIYKVDYGLRFNIEFIFLVMNEKFKEVDIHHWNVNYNCIMLKYPMICNSESN